MLFTLVLCCCLDVDEANGISAAPVRLDAWWLEVEDAGGGVGWPGMPIGAEGDVDCCFAGDGEVGCGCRCLCRLALLPFEDASPDAVRGTGADAAPAELLFEDETGVLLPSVLLLLAAPAADEVLLLPLRRLRQNGGIVQVAWPVATTRAYQLCLGCC